MIVRPLVNRELLREGRRLSHFVFRTLFVLALSAIFVWAYAVYSRFGSTLAPAAIARLGAQLFTVWALVLYAGIILFATVRAAGLADEQRTGSLPLARITALGDSGVICGWFISVIGRSFVGMILTLPVLAMVRTCGGFTTVQLLATAILVLFAGATATALTLVIAARSQSTGGAVITSLIVQIILFLFVRTRFHGFTLLWRLTRESPELGMAIALFVTFAVRAGIILILLLLAMRGLRRGPRKSRNLMKRFLLRIDRFFLELQNNKWVLWKGGLGPCKGNPVLWRERAASVLGHRDHMIRFWYVSLICTGPIAPFLILFVFLLVNPATAFARERGSNTITLLAATSLSAKEIVRGKYLFTMRRLAVPLALIVLGIICLHIANPYGKIEEVLPFIGFFVVIPLLAAQILYVCAGARTAAGGISLAAAVAGAWAGGIALMAEYGTYHPAMGRSGILPMFIQLSVTLFTAILYLYLGRRHKPANSLLLFISIAHYACLVWLLDATSSMFASWIANALVLVFLSIPLPVCLHLLVRKHRGEYKQLLLALALMLAISFCCMGMVPHPLFAMFMLTILAWRAMPYAREGGINRIILSMTGVLPLFVLLPSMMPVNLSKYRPGYGAYSDGGEPLMWIALVIAFTFLFLRALTRQLDGIMQRNDETIVTEQTATPC